MLRWGASGKRCGECRALAPTEQSSLQLLIPSKPGQVYRSCRVGREGNCTGHHSTVVPPIETNPRPALPGLILEVRRLIKLLVVINSEDATGRGGSSSGSAELREKEPCSYTRKDHERRESMEIRHAHTAGKSRNLGIVPCDREKDSCVSEDAEIVSVVCVLPDVLAREDQIFPECLLQSGVKFIEPAGPQRGYTRCSAAKKWI